MLLVLFFLCFSVRNLSVRAFFYPLFFRIFSASSVIRKHLYGVFVLTRNCLMFYIFGRYVRGGISYKFQTCGAHRSGTHVSMIYLKDSKSVWHSCSDPARRIFSSLHEELDESLLSVNLELAIITQMNADVRRIDRSFLRKSLNLHCHPFK